MKVTLGDECDLLVAVSSPSKRGAQTSLVVHRRDPRSLSKHQMVPVLGSVLRAPARPEAERAPSPPGGETVTYHLCSAVSRFTEPAFWSILSALYQPALRNVSVALNGRHSLGGSGKQVEEWGCPLVFKKTHNDVH